MNQTVNEISSLLNLWTWKEFWVSDDKTP